MNILSIDVVSIFERITAAEPRNSFLKEKSRGENMLGLSMIIASAFLNHLKMVSKNGFHLPFFFRSATP